MVPFPTHSLQSGSSLIPHLSTLTGNEKFSNLLFVSCQVTYLALFVSCAGVLWLLVGFFKIIVLLLNCAVKWVIILMWSVNLGG